MDTGNKTRKTQEGYILSEGNQIHALEWGYLGEKGQREDSTKQESIGNVCSDIITCMLI